MLIRSQREAGVAIIAHFIPCINHVQTYINIYVHFAYLGEEIKKKKKKKRTDCYSHFPFGGINISNAIKDVFKLFILLRNCLLILFSFLANYFSHAPILELPIVAVTITFNYNAFQF